MSNLKHLYIGIKGVIYNPETRKVLVLSKADNKGRRYWDIPGGRIDSDERIEDTLKRELTEEIPNIGNNYKVGKLLLAYRLSHDLDDGLGLMLLFYKVESKLETVQFSKEHDSYKWVNKDEIDHLDTRPGIYIEPGYKEALRAAFN